MYPNARLSTYQRGLRRPDSLAAVHREFLHRSGNVGATAMEDHRERGVVEDGVVGRPVAGVHQTGIFSERGIPEAVVQVLDGPVPAIERMRTPAGTRSVFASRRSDGADWRP